MEEQLLISFIVPVYNVEKYLKQCIESLVKQDSKCYEIILVNDGSTDKSGQICDMYAEQYNYIHVIHKSNGGSSEARNIGLKYAQGEYIIFVDSDDYIDTNFIRNLMKYKKLYEDIVFLNAIKVYKDRLIPLNNGYDRLQLAQATNTKNIMKQLCRLNKYPAAPWDKMIKRRMLIDNKIFFEDGACSEDIEWSLKLFLNTNSVGYINIDYYYYRQNRIGSVGNLATAKNYEAIFEVIERWCDKDLSKNKYQEEINALLSYEYMIILWKSVQLEKEEAEYIKKRLKEYKWLLKFGKYGSVQKVKLFSKVIGLKNTAKLLNIIKRAI